jgi:hypothetical protein
MKAAELDPWQNLILDATHSWDMIYIADLTIILVPLDLEVGMDGERGCEWAGGAILLLLIIPTEHAKSGASGPGWVDVICTMRKSVRGQQECQSFQLTCMKVWSREGEEAFGALALAESEWWSGDKS